MARRTREIWRNLIRQQERSGKSDEAFAAERGIPVRTLRWWKWKLRNDGDEAPSLLPVRVVASTAPMARLPVTRGAAIEVMLADGVCLRFDGDADVETVVEVVSRLRRC
jgi:hypothetical protein